MFKNRLAGAFRFVRCHFVKKSGKTRLLIELNPTLKSMNMQRIRIFCRDHGIGHLFPKDEKISFHPKRRAPRRQKDKDMKRFVVR